MSRRLTVPGPVLMFGGFVIAASLALVAAWGLGSLAQPADLDARLAAVDAQQQRIQGLLAGQGGRVIYAAEAVCPSTGAADLTVLRARLSGLAAAAGLSEVRVEVAASQPAFGDPLSPAGFEIAARGPYAAAVGLVDALQRGPALAYADAVDLHAEDAAAVRIALKGRFYCWTAASR
ncbi:MAG: hypothetical protein QM608_06215 [Caulobacter sp.]